MPSYRVFNTAVAAAEKSVGSDPALLPSVLARATVEVLAVDGASLSLQSGKLRVPLGSSDAASAAAERAQCMVGEGPCLDAIAFGIVVHAPGDRLRLRWPVLAERWMAQTPFRSALSVPVPSPTDIGCAINLYFVADHGGSTVLLRDAVQVAAVTADRLGLLGETGLGGGPKDPGWVATPPAVARQRVWVAVGMVMEATGHSAAEALDLMRARAYAADGTLDELAQDMISLAPEGPEWLQ